MLASIGSFVMNDSKILYLSLAKLFNIHVTGSAELFFNLFILHKLLRLGFLLNVNTSVCT